jgi:hypothetical protein
VNNELFETNKEISIHTLIISQKNYKPKKSSENVNFPELPSDNEALIGRRIVDLAYFLQNLKNIGDHFSGMNCTFEFLEFKKEIRLGINSRLFFQYELCRKPTLTDRNYTKLQQKKRTGT